MVPRTTLLGLVLILPLFACEGEAPKVKAVPSAATAAAVPVENPIPTPPNPPPKPPKPPKQKKSLADCPKGKLVWESPEVEAAVRQKLQKPAGELRRADLARLRSLNLSQIRLDELDPCLFALTPQLKELFLGRGEVTDLSALEGLRQLESLRLSLNPITELAPLAGMTRLDRVDLAHTQIRDLSPLAGLTNLTELLLDDTPVSDVTPLAKLEKLEVLVLKNTQVKDLSPLRGLKALKTLDIRGAPVDDPSTVMRPGLRVQMMD